MPGKTTKRTRGRPPTARGRGATTTINDNQEPLSQLLKKYEEFRVSLDEQIKKLKAQRTDELRQLEIEEEEFFHRQCNLYSAEQLDMTVDRLEKMLQEEADAEPKITPALQNREGLTDQPVVFRIPVKQATKKKRRSSVIQYNSATATPAWRASRGGPTLPKFVTTGTGIKNREPRLPHLGEVTYSDNGSPVVTLDQSKPKPQPRKGKMALADLNVDV